MYDNASAVHPGTKKGVSVKSQLSGKLKRLFSNNLQSSEQALTFDLTLISLCFVSTGT